MSFLFGKKKQEIVLVLDIGSGSVGAGLLLLREAEIPKFIYTTRIPIAVEAKPDSKKMLALLKSHLDGALKNVSTQGKKYLLEAKLGAKVNRAFCVFASPWCASKTSVIKIENEQPISVSKKYIEDLLVKERDVFEGRATQDDTSGAFQGQVTLIERTIVQTRVNGYETLHPYGVKSKLFEMSVFMSIMSWEVIGAVENAIASVFHIHNVAMHSFTMCAFSIISDIFVEQGNYAFLDIASEVTDVTVVKNGMISETLSFPAGKNTLIRNIADDMGVLPEIALSYLAMRAQGTLDLKLSIDVEESVKRAERDWFVYYSHALAEFGKTHIVPQKIYMTADTDVVGLFEKLLKEEGEKDGTDISVLNRSIFDRFVKTYKDTSLDPFLALESIFANKLFHTNNSNIHS